MKRLNSQQPILLAGFMGTGKTEVGRLVAERLGRPFFDTDEIIEARVGMSVAEIFATEGEIAFRAHERAAIADYVSSPSVVALGGGALMNPETAELVYHQRVFLLTANAEEIAARVAGDPDRPLLSDIDPADPNATARRIGDLMASRAPGYKPIRLSIDTSRHTPQEVADTILEWLTLDAHTLPLKVDMRHFALPHSRPRVEVNGGGSFIHVGSGIIKNLAQLLREVGLTGRCIAVVPEQLTDVVGKRVTTVLEESGIGHDVIPIRDGDENKKLQAYSGLLDELVRLRADRGTALLAVGGGVTGDLAGFAAASYMRGMPLVQIPTTLLAQVDASIGGKTGVNHREAKNLIGAIYQPLVTIADVEFLDTLPDRELANGMAEVIKTAVIDAPDLFVMLEALAESEDVSVLRRADVLERCVFECARVKAGIVQADPYETGPRRLLNLGHTLGHALEIAAGHRHMPHGAAVSIGLVAAAQIAAAKGQADPFLAHRVDRVLRWCGLPTSVQGVDTEAVRAAMRLDKKHQNGRLRYIIPRDVGKVIVVDDITIDDVVAVIEGGTTQ